MNRYANSILIGLAITMLATAACTSNTFNPEATQTLIVEGYLYAGATVDSVKVSQLIPFVTDTNADYSISNAEVTLFWNDNVYPLTYQAGTQGHYGYEGTALQIVEGQQYSLTLNHNGQTATATTTVPTRPTGVSLSFYRLEVAPIDDFEDLFNRGEQEPLEVLWDNPTAEPYYVLIENTEESPEEINQLDFDGFGRPNFSFITEPTTLDVYNVLPFSLTQYGRYRVVVFHVNQSYADLYETAEQDSRNLTEPLSNINNGLGIFTSFSSDTVYLDIVKP